MQHFIIGQIWTRKKRVWLVHWYDHVLHHSYMLIGTHGIRISFVHPTSNKKMDATYLPQVCAEQGWNHEECLYSLYKKAGYKSQITKELLANTKLTRYQSVTCALTYDQYSKMSATTFWVKPCCVRIGQADALFLVDLIWLGLVIFQFVGRVWCWVVCEWVPKL